MVPLPMRLHHKIWRRRVDGSFKPTYTTTSTLQYRQCVNQTSTVLYLQCSNQTSTLPHCRRVGHVVKSCVDITPLLTLSPFSVNVFFLDAVHTTCFLTSKSGVGINFSHDLFSTYDCVSYWSEFSNLQHCPTCGKARYKFSPNRGKKFSIRYYGPFRWYQDYWDCLYRKRDHLK